MRRTAKFAGIDPLEIIYHFHPEDTPLRRLFLKHSEQVRNKALAILADSPLDLDARLVAQGAMLHDIGIVNCHAPKILCMGTEPYIAHGVIGAALLREFGRRNGIDLEIHARICERHTGSGITAAEVRAQSLPIPEQDYLPETLEEKLICLADKFFSKSGDMQEKSLDRIRRSMQKFGEDSLARFDELCICFQITDPDGR